MTKLGKRISVNGSEVNVKAPKGIFTIAELVLVMTTFTLYGGSLFLNINAGEFKNNKDLLSLIVFLCLWVLIEAYFCYIFLWVLFGRESISLEGRFLIIRRLAFGYGRTRRFEFNNISNLRVSGFGDSPAYWLLSKEEIFFGPNSGRVAFDYKGRETRFGIKLKKGDAEQLVSTMKEIFGL